MMMTPTHPLKCSYLPSVDELLANKRDNIVRFDSQPGVNVSGVRCQIAVKQSPHAFDKRRSSFRVVVFMTPSSDVRDGRDNVGMSIDSWCANAVLEQLGIDFPLDVKGLTEAIENKDYNRVKEMCLAVNKE